MAEGAEEVEGEGLLLFLGEEAEEEEGQGTTMVLPVAGRRNRLPRGVGGGGGSGTYGTRLHAVRLKWLLAPDTLGKEAKQTGHLLLCTH